MRHSLIPASYVAFLRGEAGREEVLLHLRQNTGYRDGHWALVAGHVEKGETPAVAAAREAAEEIGVVVDPADLEPLVVLQRSQPDEGPVEQRVDFFFACRRWTGEPRRVEPTKNAELRWCDLRSRPRPGVPHETTVLDALAEGRGMPPFVATDEAGRPRS